MLPILIDIFCGMLTYLVLMQMYILLQQSNTHSFVVRIVSVFLSYLFISFIADYLFHNVMISYEALIDPYGMLPLFAIILLDGVFFWAIRKGADKLQVVEMSNYIRTSLIFGNYFRLRDVDTQEKIGTHNMKKIFEEVHGRPFTDDVIATPFDQQVTKFKKVSLDELKVKTKRFPPEYHDQMQSLKERQLTDVSVAFRFQLLDAGFHPLLPLIEHVQIDPVSMTISIEIVYPLEKSFSLKTPVDRTRLIESVYQALHVLIDQEWYHLYAHYTGTLSVLCSKREFGDQMLEKIVPLMSLRISYNKLRNRTNRITTITEIESIAEIQFF